MVVRNLPANTSHLRGSSSKSNCKRDEIPFIVLGWMQWAGAPEAALALPRNVPADGPLPCSQCHLGAQAMSPAWGGWREMAQKLSQKDCFLERVLCWKEALPGPASSSPGLQNSMGILPAWLRLAGSFPGMAGAFPPWQELSWHGRSFPSSSCLDSAPAEFLYGKERASNKAHTK